MTDHNTPESQPRVLTDHGPLTERLGDAGVAAEGPELHVGTPQGGILHTGARVQPTGLRTV